ncbi:helix-turn-helix domain-containing protein [Streptomyces vinaceus]|uniref:helix-turn-helix domain-containing protein n=1 Tax=Streptomyces vinaceus TaxID=1960 RepID=UPI0036942A87
MTNDQTPAPAHRGPELGQLRRPRLTGEKRDEVRAAMADAYNKDKTTSVRSLAELHEVSYGLAWTLLHEAKVVLRDRASGLRKGSK